METLDVFLLCISFAINVLLEILMTVCFIVTDDIRVIKFCVLIIILFIPNLIFLIRRAID